MAVGKTAIFSAKQHCRESHRPKTLRGRRILAEAPAQPAQTARDMVGGPPNIFSMHVHKMSANTISKSPVNSPGAFMCACSFYLVGSAGLDLQSQLVGRCVCSELFYYAPPGRS
jgi:hypothetical protein